jgi:hypothetical protein
MSRLSLHQPARYRLVVGAHVGGGETAIWSESFICEYGRSAAGDPITTIEGTLPDQAALHGILIQIRDWGLPIHQVQWLGDGSPSNQ